MKKYLIASPFILGSFVSPLLADETTGIYFSLGGGITAIGDVEGDFAGVDASYSTDNPFGYSIAIGKELSDWRLEFNYTATTVSSDSITVTVGGNGVTADLTPDREVEAKSYMLYGYKDFPSESNTKLTPYLGAGLGSTTFSVDAQTVAVGGVNVALEAGDDQAFTFGLKGGIDYEIVENTSLYSEVSYLNTSSFTTVADENYDSISSFEIQAGFKFKF